MIEAAAYSPLWTRMDAVASQQEWLVAAAARADAERTDPRSVEVDSGPFGAVDTRRHDVACLCCCCACGAVCCGALDVHAPSFFFRVLACSRVGFAGAAALRLGANDVECIADSGAVQ
jgi:hypothetical protein